MLQPFNYYFYSHSGNTVKTHVMNPHKHYNFGNYLNWLGLLIDEDFGILSLKNQ